MTAMLHVGDFVRRGHRVTLVSPSEYHYYSGMGPGMLAGTYRPQQVRFQIRDMVEERGADFVEDSVARIDPSTRTLRLESGVELGYDAVSFNTGSYVPTDPMVPEPQENVFPVKPIFRLLEAQALIRRRIQDGESVRILVVGGGAAGVEMAGNVSRLVEQTGGRCEVTLVAGRRLLHAYPDRARAAALASFNARMIRLLEGAFVERLDCSIASLSYGQSIPYDVAFAAVGVRPYPLFRDSGMPAGENGGLLVNEHLQSVEHPGVFGGGDCISFSPKPLDKVGVYAVRENPILRDNLLASLEGGSLRSFEPQEHYMLIFNMGDGTGIFVRRSLVWRGKIVFRLKNYIDLRFMRRFQVSGETEEEFASPG